MACTNCSTGRGNSKDLLPAGCQNNGTCGTGGCNKLNVFDWLSNMQTMDGQSKFDWVEVRFKNTRKEFFKNTEKLQLSIGDAVATEGSPGHDIGIVSLTGELVKIQMKKAEFVISPSSTRKIFRKARPADIDKWKSAIEQEKDALIIARRHANDLKLDMKLSDAEFQGDGTKVTFYYIAENRVDFREMIKLLARDLKVRIEMRQIGSRQEAGRVGGIGSCGRELCCSTWLKDFRTVTTAAARYQQLSINPQKLAGQCGKLKCCLNFELESYMDAIKEFPKADVQLRTKAGTAFHVKTDIFQRVMYYAYKEEPNTFHKLPLERVHEIIQMNKNNELPEALTDEAYTEKTAAKPTLDFSKVGGEDSISRFDNANRKKKKKKKKSGNQAPNQAQGNQNQPRQNQNRPQGNKNQGGGNQQGNPNRNQPPQNKNNQKSSVKPG
jgi:cell fate regulator YaaT (PSP1 superfamily)